MKAWLYARSSLVVQPGDADDPLIAFALPLL
jgi:hypothetical protein